MNYRDKKVLILGLGLNEGGVGSAKFFAKQGAEVLVSDIKDEQSLKPSIEKLNDFPNIQFHFGSHNKADIDWADLIIKNQAIKSDNDLIIYAQSQGKDIQTDVSIFLSYVNPKNIIGVTGTKGKSTTSSLIYEVISASGKEVILVGNIGKSVLDSINQINENTLIIFETSSFQLESFDKLKISPKYALITNIYPDHLNYYGSMEKYIKAKRLIAKYQTEEDFLFINKDDKTITSEEFLEGINSKIIFYSPQDLPQDLKPQLLGNHNLANIAGALAVAKVLNINEEIALKALAEFKGVEFRLQLIKEYNGIKIYNNTTATAPEPAIESLKTFPNCILIAGGMNKNLEYDEFSKAINKYAKSVYFLEGDATDQIIQKLNERNATVLKYGPFNNLETLLSTVKNEAEPGDTILFSPGATSFNLFQNEFDRGRKFNAAVSKIFP